VRQENAKKKAAYKTLRKPLLLRADCHPDGWARLDEHFQQGRRRDPPDGSLATVSYHRNGCLRGELHWRAGEPRDADYAAQHDVRLTRES
jgi:hypothetical protein